MPILTNDAPDDAPVFDVCESFTAGQASYTRSNRIEPNQAPRLTNLDINRDGEIATRRGTQLAGTYAAGAASRHIQGLAYFDTPAIERLMAVEGGKLFAWDNHAATTGDPWSEITGFTTSDITTDVFFAQGVDKLYMTDGIGTLHAWDGITMTDFGSGGTSQPPLANFIVWHTQRLFAAGIAAVPDEVACSDLLNAAVWDTGGAGSLGGFRFRVGAGDGDPVVALSPWIDFDLVVLKRGSLWVVNTNPAQPVPEWSINCIHRRIGCVAPRSVTQVGQDVWFLSDAGVRSVRRVIATDQNEVTDCISDDVKDVIQRINWRQAHKAAAVFHNNRYMISLPLDGASEPNYTLVYDTQTKGWSGLWTWPAKCFAVSAFGGDYRLNFGRGDLPQVEQWLDYVPPADETDDTFADRTGADALGSFLLTRSMTFAEPISRKRAYFLEAEFTNSAAVASLSVVLDQAEPLLVDQSVATQSAITLLLPLTLPFILPSAGILRRKWPLLGLPPFREMQVQVESQSGKLAVRQLLAAAFVEAMEIQQ